MKPLRLERTATWLRLSRPLACRSRSSGRKCVTRARKLPAPGLNLQFRRVRQRRYRTSVNSTLRLPGRFGDTLAKFAHMQGPRGSPTRLEDCGLSGSELDATKPTNMSHDAKRAGRYRNYALELRSFAAEMPTRGARRILENLPTTSNKRRC